MRLASESFACVYLFTQALSCYGACSESSRIRRIFSCCASNIIRCHAQRGYADSLRLGGGSLGTGSSILPPSYCKRSVDLVQKSGEIEDAAAEHQRHQNQVGPEDPERNTDRPRHLNLGQPFRGTLLFQDIIQRMDDAESVYIRGYSHSCHNSPLY